MLKIILFLLRAAKNIGPKIKNMKMTAFLTASAILFYSGLALSQVRTLGPKDTFAAARLSQRESLEVVEGVEQSAYDTPDSWDRELRVRLVDLGAVYGLVVQGSNLLCGATGNCQI
jgi:hypothetical protein